MKKIIILLLLVFGLFIFGKRLFYVEYFRDNRSNLRYNLFYRVVNLFSDDYFDVSYFSQWNKDIEEDVIVYIKHNIAYKNDQVLRDHAKKLNDDNFGLRYKYNLRDSLVNTYRGSLYNHAYFADKMLHNAIGYYQRRTDHYNIIVANGKNDKLSNLKNTYKKNKTEIKLKNNIVRKKRVSFVTSFISNIINKEKK